jgi:signal transduction histidine kinase
MVVASAPASPIRDEPAVLTAVRAEKRDGRFDGAMAAVLTLSTSSPRPPTATCPAGPRWPWPTPRARSSPRPTPGVRRAAHGLAGQAVKSGSALWSGKRRRRPPRDFSAAPLVGNEVFVILSAKAPGLASWAWLNPMLRLLAPLLAFVLALAAVLYATEQAVIRWIVYLRRVAAIYARGRFTVRPLQAERAPPEIRELAATLDDMAAGIVARDASLRDSLGEKDALMREIHHRVKNNLQIISSLLNMQQRALTDPAARTALNDTRQRITALAQIYRALYQGPTSSAWTCGRSWRS